MAKTAGHTKNRPTFFSILLTLLFVAAGVVGVYKVYPYVMQGGIISAFVPEKEMSVEPVTVSETEESTSAAEESTTAADEDAAAVARAIGEADDSFSAALLTYCADHLRADALQGVLDALESGKYTPEVWFTSTGNSLYALNALADGDVESGLVLDRTAEKKSTVDIAFVGRVNPALADKVQDNLSADLLKAMKGADILAAGNETVFSKDGAASFRAEEKRAALYEDMGVDVVTLASLHISDYGGAGVRSTVSALDEAKIAHVGAGADENAASTPVYFLAGGRKIAVIGAAKTYYWKKTQAATGSSAGVFSLTTSGAAVEKAVKKAKENCDYVFVYMNAGMDENATWFDSDQQTWAKSLIKAGADGVVGAQSNKMQGMEFYQGKLIVYGLGDLWVDEASRNSGMYRVSIAPDGTMQHTLLPCRQQDGKASLCTTDADKATVFRWVEKYCGNVVQIRSDGTIVKNGR